MSLTQYFKQNPNKRPDVEHLYIRHFKTPNKGVLSAYAEDQGDYTKVAFAFCSPKDTFSRTEALRAAFRLDRQFHKFLVETPKVKAEAVADAFETLIQAGSLPKNFKNWKVIKTPVVRGGNTYVDVDIRPEEPSLG